MFILLGISWQFPLVLVGILHTGPMAWTAPFVLLGMVHGSSQMFVPLYFMALLSGFRYRLVRKGNLRSSKFMYGVECAAPGCLWATPICDDPGQAYEREEIHTKATGHLSYELISARSTQLEVI